MTPGLIVAAPCSGAGKTIVTLGLLRALARAGTRVAPFKVGPDYIDPAFLAAAAGRDCVNLDSWAMRATTLEFLLADLARDSDLIIGEGVMGLFDGGPGGAGGTADLAHRIGLPVVLVVDASGMGGSIAALVEGFARHAAGVAVAGVIANRTGGEGHRAILAGALAASGVPLLGALPRDAALALPSRHLGLVQARETGGLEGIVERAADAIAAHVDIAALRALATPPNSRVTSWDEGGKAGVGDGQRRGNGLAPPPLGQRIAVARDVAFAFAYPATLAAWRGAGADLSFFSPLADEAPGRDTDAVYLPGGYPELHAGRLAANRGFLEGLRAAAGWGAAVFGECGGYMVLGRALIDAKGVSHAMAGLLPHVASFSEPRLHLGYRAMRVAADGPLGPAGTTYRGHEFHYASVAGAEGVPLFHAWEASGRDLGPMGSVSGRVAGSFLHLIDGA